MVNDENKDLVVREDTTPSGEPERLSEAMGGYQALALFGIIAAVMLVVFAFPTPSNPAVQTATEPNLLVALGELQVEQEPDLVAALDNLDVAEATEEPTAEATEEPTAEATEEPTAEATEEPTEEPTAEVTEEPTAEATEEPTTAEATEEPTAGATEEVTTEMEAAAEGQWPATVADAIAAGDPANGETVFLTPYDTAAGTWMCSSCHSVDAAQARQVGPALWGLSDRIDERAADSGDVNGVAYTYISILMPEDYHVIAEPDYPRGLMPPNYGEVLTEQELADVVAYVLTLGNPDF